MSKIKCKRCGDYIDSDLIKCPHCFSYIDDVDEPFKYHSLTKRYIIASVLAIIMFLAILGHFSFLNNEENFELNASVFFASLLSLTINFALVSIAPLLIKIFNRKFFLEKCTTIFFANAAIIYIIYSAFHDFFSTYYTLSLPAMLIYSVIAELYFYNPNEKYEQDIDHIFEDEEDIDAKIDNKVKTRLSDLKTNDSNISNDSFDEKYEKLNKLKELYDNEILTKEEFETEKQKILK